MARTGHTVENPATGDRVIFRQTAADTDGELLQIEYIVTRLESEPHIPLHIHLVSEERFEVLQGKLGVIIGKERSRRILDEGESIRIPPGTPHTFWNAGKDELHFLTDIRPPGAFQTYWETIFGLAGDGKVNAQGLPNIWQLMVLATVADSYAAGAPPALAKAIIAILAPIGRLLGYRARYPQYSG